jgi:putative ABC transport system permease protein
MFSILLSDSHSVLRQMRRNPAVSLVAILTLALGIGATTAIFSVVYGVLLRPLPYPHPSRIVSVLEISSQGSPSGLADPNFDDFRDQSRSFQSIAKYGSNTVSISGASQPTRTSVAYVSPAFLTVLGVQPTLGRDFTASDAHKGAAPTALVSYAYWRTYLASESVTSPNLPRLKIDNSLFTIIGVLPPGFRFPLGAELWLPTDLDGESVSRTAHNYYAIARLRDGVSLARPIATSPPSPATFAKPPANKATISSKTPPSFRSKIP